MSPLLVRRCGDGSTVIHLFDVWPPLKPLRHTRHTSFPATPCCPASPTKGQSSPPSSPSRNTTDGWHGSDQLPKLLCGNVTDGAVHLICFHLSHALHKGTNLQGPVPATAMPLWRAQSSLVELHVKTYTIKCHLWVKIDRDCSAKK